MMRKEKIPRSVNEPKQREQNMRQKESRTVWPFEGFWTIKGHPTHPVSTGSWLLAPKLPSWLVAPPTPKHRNTPHQVQIIRMNFQPPTTPFFWLTQIYPIDPSSEEAATWAFGLGGCLLSDAFDQALGLEEDGRGRRRVETVQMGAMWPNQDDCVQGCSYRNCFFAGKPGRYGMSLVY